MNQSRDIRSLQDYRQHFAKYNKRVLNISNCSEDTVGIVESVDGVEHFVPVVYYGNKIYDRLLKDFVKGE